MANTCKADVAVVGAGILGLAHAYVAARSGRSVAVFERSPAALGASIRNFGMIWPIGLPAGALHELGLRSRAIWQEILQDANLPFLAAGSLHVAYREDEAAVGREFAQRAPSLGFECEWLAPEETLRRSRAIRPDGLAGALWSDTEMTVDPRQILRELPQYLMTRFGVRFFFNAAVRDVKGGVVLAGDRQCDAGTIVVAGGDDFQTLFPECFADSGLTRCKLQMMRTAQQPDAWQLGPSLAFGLTFTHYPVFRSCAGVQALRSRIARETPDLEKWGIHVMVSQTSSGQLTIGDSHEYGLAVDIFDKPFVNELILDYAKRFLRVPTLEIAEHWHGVYARHPDRPFLSLAPREGVRVVTVTNGLGMTMSFGIAEQSLREAGVAA